MHQHTLFDDLAQVRARRAAGKAEAHHRAAALVQGIKRGEIGMRLAADKADHINSGWCAAALERLRAFARASSGEWTMEQARCIFMVGIPVPSDLRAFGRVTRDGARLGYIVKTGRMAPAASSNAAQKPLWCKGPQA